MIALTIPLKWWSRSVSVGKSQVLRPAEAETMPTMQHWHPYQPKLSFRCNLIHHDNFSFKIQSFLCKKVRLQFKPAGMCRSSSKYTDLEIPVNQKLLLENPPIVDYYHIKNPTEDFAACHVKIIPQLASTDARVPCSHKPGLGRVFSLLRERSGQWSRSKHESPLRL